MPAFLKCMAEGEVDEAFFFRAEPDVDARHEAGREPDSRAAAVAVPDVVEEMVQEVVAVLVDAADIAEQDAVDRHVPQLP